MRRLLFVLAVLLVCMLLSAAGLAETVEIHDFLVCSPGDVRLPVFPDFSHYIGEGLTKDDFIITYASSSPKVTLEADGTVHIASDVPLLTNFPLEITYTPRVEGVGEKTAFACRLRTLEAINQITPEQTFYRLRPEETISPIVELHGGSTSLVASVTAGDGLVVDKVSQWGTDSIRLYIISKKPGTSKVTIKAYNGTSAEIEIDVVGPPMQFKFAKEHFTCYVGEDINLGLDTGNGPYGLDYYYDFYTQIFCDGEVMPNGYYQNLTGVFSAPTAGEYHIICSYGDVKGETWVTVLDREDYTEPDARLPGDADGNGTVSPADVVAILDALANGGALYTDNANVNGDAAIDIQDALLILQHAAGWNVPLK